MPACRRLRENKVAAEYSKQRQIAERATVIAIGRSGRGLIRFATMAGFQTHITVSTVTGVAYGVWGYQCGAPIQTCALAGALCSVSGMLPDLDSDSGRPVQEMSALAAAVVPLLMLDRFKDFGWSHETMAIVGAAIYVAIRFGIAGLFKR